MLTNAAAQATHQFTQKINLQDTLLFQLLWYTISQAKKKETGFFLVKLQNYKHTFNMLFLMHLLWFSDFTKIKWENVTQ